MMQNTESRKNANLRLTKKFWPALSFYYARFSGRRYPENRLPARRERYAAKENEDDLLIHLDCLFILTLLFLSVRRWLN